jgi:shikimate kinase
MDARIFLIGFMGSGKSTHGSKLARMIGYSYVDMDRLIEQTAGMSIPDIFREHGEEAFRKWEHDILMELCRRQKVVVSTGGGAACHGEMIKIMNQHGCTIYIKLSPPALKHRLLLSKTERPLIKGKNEEELLAYIEQLLEAREFYYHQARHTVDGAGLQTERLVELVRTTP